MYFEYDKHTNAYILLYVIRKMSEMEYTPLPILICFVGIFLLIRLRCFFLIHPVKTLKKMIAMINDKRSFKALTLALAGTLGVGNVFGVAVGLIIGGPGSLFWLFISMIFAMAIKYSEVTIAADNLYRDSDAHGGMYYCLKQSFKKGGSILSVLYALFAVLISLLMGAALQSGTVSESATELFNIKPSAVGLILLILTLASIIGGAAKIEKVTSILVPLTTIIYIILTFTIILINIEKLPSVVKTIFTSAFSRSSAVGGAVSFIFSRAVREGFSRGILSNEAGAGTSSMAYARSGSLNPAALGLFGIVEVVFDTGILCMLTGLSILSASPELTSFNGGMKLCLYAVGSVFGPFGEGVLMLSVFAFAFATVICWYYYGAESFSAVFGARRRIVFLLLFLFFIFIGASVNTLLLVKLVDLGLTVMTFLTVLVLIKNSDRLVTLSEKGGIIDLRSFESEKAALRRVRKASRRSRPR